MPREPSRMSAGNMHPDARKAQAECLWMIANQLERIADALEATDDA